MPHDSQSPLVKKESLTKPPRVTTQASTTSGNNKSYFKLQGQESDMIPSGGCNLDFLEDDLFEIDVKSARRKSNTF